MDGAQFADALVAIMAAMVREHDARMKMPMPSPLPLRNPVRRSPPPFAHGENNIP
jgi:hypothetical protein